MSSVPSTSGISITGGIPTKAQDLAPHVFLQRILAIETDSHVVARSIIFIIGYACLIPLAVWRLASKESRTTTLIRPAVFILVRIATFVVRSIQASGNYNETIFIIEQVFLLGGFPVICEAILSLLEYHITRTHTSPKQGQVTQRVVRMLRLALLAALVLGIIAGTQYSSAIGHPDKLQTLRTLRNVNAGLCLAIVLGVIAVAAVAQVHKNLPVKPTLLLIFMSGCLAVAGAYRLANIHLTSDPFAVTTKIKFYVLLALMEWLVTLTLFAVNARILFAEDLAQEKKRAARHGSSSRGEHVPLGMYDHAGPGQQFKDPYATA